MSNIPYKRLLETYKNPDSIFDKNKKSSKVVLNNFLKNSPIPEEELTDNIALYMDRRVMMRVLNFREIYEEFLHLPGVIMEFGVRWGRDLSLLTNLRGHIHPQKELQFK